MKIDEHLDKNFNWLNKNIIIKNFCSNCGTCVGACPTNAIGYFSKDAPSPKWINNDKCVNCSICIKVCPGKGYDIRKLVNQNPGKGTSYNDLHGYYEFFAHGYSKNNKIRKNGASGGLATELLVYLLNKKIVDYVIVVQLTNGNPEIKITDNIDDVIKAQQSKYCPVPMNSVLLQKLMQSDYKFALVGTPCQIAGQILAENKIKKLNGKIIIRIGLFCGYIQSLDALNAVKKRMNIPPKDQNWEFMGWRVGEYPGSMCFKNKITEEKLYKPLYECLDICVPFFSLKRCFFCPDGNNELADIVLGDVHQKGQDENVIICRTQKGKKLLEDAKKEGLIDYYIPSFVESEGTIPHIGIVKKKYPLSLIDFFNKLGMSSPEFALPVNISRKEYLNAVKNYLLIRVCCNKVVKSVLSKFPRFMEFLGSMIYRFSHKMYTILKSSRLFKRLE